MRTKLQTRHTRPTPSPFFPRPPPVFALVCPRWHVYFWFLNFFFFLAWDIMLARLLVRWPRSSPVVVHAHARAFRATSLARTAVALKPMSTPAASAYEPPVDQSTNRTHFSSTRFADASISNSSKMAIPHECARFIRRYTARSCRCANNILDT